MAERKKQTPKEKELEDQVTHLLSEWLNDNAPIGEEGYRLPAAAAIAKVRSFLRRAAKESNNG